MCKIIGTGFNGPNVLDIIPVGFDVAGLEKYAH